ncbi:CCCH zinc finger protein [Rasamsonia emersonii CBS 393.64]|uniref:CCCH zinc finger protein n=1 Tax=Rasamsonia emersonii (strain ATCC 16479 / CBS 393.64 / IMI 116815) TaxID=1408163 RepID=A0A0F4Z012_RASE3|nr:CCCH zinc finger protein [Rasamsonia emersonii CBS 393.64]KKA23839.1 CCCH zinc finger protein [Rasamsonia emersonii CBS 393.64]
MTEEQDLLAKISQLAGKINQHKNRASQAQSQHPNASYYNTRYQRGGWAPYRVRGPQRRPVTHRNRTLVLNNPQAPAADKANLTGNSGDHDGEVKPGGSNGWVAKRDRHIQLINSAIYNKEAQARTKAIAETQRLKAERRAKAEEAKVMRYVHGNGRQLPSAVPAQAAGTSQRPTSYQIMVNDIPFQVARGGSKLIRISSAKLTPQEMRSRAGLPMLDDPSTANATPKRVTIGGVTFVRTCPYIHNPDKVAICKDFLQIGKCHAGESCDLSHEPSPHRSPVCVHFLRGRCSNPECRYAHVRVTPGAPVCRAFAVLGYCEKGAECEERHVYECPDYANTGTCNKRKCHLPHVDRAGQIRKNAANRAESPTPDGEEDVSSDEEEYDEIDSDDVDSDELDDDPVEVIEGGAEDSELSGQKDFVRF